MCFIIRFVLILLALLASANGFEQFVSIDTSRNYFKTTPDMTEKQALSIYQKLEIEIVNTRQVKPNNYYYLLFRYRDLFFSNIYARLLKNKSNPLIKVWSFNAISLMRDKARIELIKSYRNSQNSIFREMAANAFSFFGDSSDIGYLSAWKAEEKNQYVLETIKASLKIIDKKGYPDLFPYLPVYYKTDIKKLKFFYNKAVESKDKYHQYYIAKKDGTKPIKTSGLVYPHQQYLYPLKNAPKNRNFGNNHNGIYHTGEDSGWFLEGLPIHSICDGVVKNINHETSWGVFMAIESRLPNDSNIMVYYGHLSKHLNVMVGDTVYAGEKIGQIGNSVSYENGGYWPHLHLGIEKSAWDNASFAGYDNAIQKWHSPYELIERF